MPPASDLVAPARLAEFFAPRSLAVVGASDTSGWARFLLASSVAADFDGPLRDVSLRVLPAGKSEVLAMLGELRGVELLRGARGQIAADLDKVLVITETELAT